MLKLTVIGLYVLGLSMLTISLLGILELVVFNPLSGLVLYFFLKELSGFIAALSFQGNEEGE